ncbi:MULTISPECIES: hypothetical protein [Halobacterium]|uniref:hypothetical protein n=1 Tax=Halobacterium TaxID=2239 RepID=UPI00073EBB66|nr:MULTISPECIES: hypothetical protein [Halobacterium]MCG1004879.1 hypothetical protein [Halobacterium noricense]
MSQPRFVRGGLDAVVLGVARVRVLETPYTIQLFACLIPMGMHSFVIIVPLHSIIPLTAVSPVLLPGDYLYTQVIITSMPQEERRNLTGYVRESTAEDVEEWANEHGFSKARAVDELLTEALEDETWTDTTQRAKDALDTPELSAFVLAGIRPDGQSRVQSATRPPGLDEDHQMTDPDRLSPQTQAALLCLAIAAEQQREGLDMEIGEYLELVRGVWEAVYEKGETAGVEWVSDNE